MTDRHFNEDAYSDMSYKTKSIGQNETSEMCLDKMPHSQDQEVCKHTRSVQRVTFTLQGWVALITYRLCCPIH